MYLNMKIISLIELTRGTGISQYLSSFAMIEKENLMIIDTNKHTILEDLLGITTTSKEISRYAKYNYFNNKNCYELEIFFCRFHNLYIRSLQLSEKPDVDLTINIVAYIKSLSSFKNCKYLIVYFPFRNYSSDINQIVSNFDYSVIFCDSKPLIKSELIKHLEIIAERRKYIGFVYTKSEENSQYPIESESILIKTLGILPYNLLIQNATINNKVFLEIDGKNRHANTIREVWNKIKSKVAV